MVRRVHHIDFVVRDLEAAARRYREILGVEPRERERLDDRGVELVRFELGDVWIILVQPVKADSPVAAFLERHGEGFFHIAYKVDNVADEAERLGAADIALAGPPRKGVEGWRLLDLEPSATFGVYTQLIEEPGD